MNPRPLLLLGIAVPVILAAPPEITPEQLADFERQVAPRVIPHIDGIEIFRAGQQLNEQVTIRMENYLDKVGQTTLITQEEEPLVEQEGDPLDRLFEPGPQSLVISCSKGLYLDGENREIVYLGNIKVDGNMEGRELTMTCNRDLKAIFNPAPPKEGKEKGEEATDKADKDPLSKFGGFGDLKQFTATGRVRLNGVNEKGQKVYFGGDRALYEMAKEGDQIDATITMRGDKLAFMAGDPDDPNNKEGVFALRSISPDAWVVAEIKDGIIKARFSGREEEGVKQWKTVVLIPEKEKKDGE